MSRDNHLTIDNNKKPNNKINRPVTSDWMIIPFSQALQQSCSSTRIKDYETEILYLTLLYSLATVYEKSRTYFQRNAS